MTHYHDSGRPATRPSSRTRPQTLGYGLVDSPAGQAAWIVEKFWAWTDCDGHPENVLTRDELLDNVMLYWLPGTGRVVGPALLGELPVSVDFTEIEVPVGCSIFPKEIFRTSRRWAEGRFSDLRFWNEPDKGGHFAAFEQPERVRARRPGVLPARCAERSAAGRPERDRLGGRVVGPQPGRQQDRVGELARVVVLSGRHREVGEDREREAHRRHRQARVARRAGAAGGRPAASPSCRAT